MLEQELNRKLFNQAEQSINEIQFDRSAMLSTDKQSLAEYYKSMLVNWIMTINEVRRALNLNDIENGDNLFMQLNMSTIKNIIEQTPPDQKDLKQKIKAKIVAESDNKKGWQYNNIIIYKWKWKKKLEKYN